MEELVTGLHLESTRATCDMVALMVGKSKKTPRPALPCRSKTEIPRRSSGVNDVKRARETLSTSAWKGMALILVSGLYFVRNLVRH